ncbi:hypothetical protein HOF92_11000 [bacterium]|nr:hypothetical protein [bacterium]
MKTLSSWLLIVGSIAFLFGCTATQVPEMDFLQQALRPVTIQGTLTSATASKSIASFTLPDSVTASQEPINKTPKTSEGTRIGVVDEKGKLLEEDVFFPSTTTGEIPFQFQGRLAQTAIRLRVLKDDVPYEIALGTIEAGSSLHELGTLDFQREALATRYLEQSSSYRILSNQSPEEFRFIREEVFKNRIEPLGAWSEIVQEIHRVGVDENGKMAVFEEGYDPGNHKNPTQKPTWEPLLFEPWTTSVSDSPVLSMDSASLTPEQNQPGPISPPLPSVLRNLLKSVTLNSSGPPLTLFHARDFREPVPRIVNSTSMRIDLEFHESLPGEHLEEILDNGTLQVVRKKETYLIKIQDLSSHTDEANLLSLEIPFTWPVFLFEEEHKIYFQQNLTPFHPLEVPHAFFKIVVTPKQSG